MASNKSFEVLEKNGKWHPVTSKIGKPSYKGEDCSQPISATEQTFDTVAYLVDPFLYQLIVIALGIILTFACIVLILVRIFMRLQKKKYFEHDRPLLDLDEEDAIELETNPMDNVSMLNFR